MFYRDQLPYMAAVPTTVFDAGFTIDVPYQQTLPDGTTVTKLRSEIAHRNLPIQFVFDECRTQHSAAPKFNLISFLLGSHTDVSVDSIMLPLNAVTQDAAKDLRRFKQLRRLVIQQEEYYYSVEHSSRLDSATRKQLLVPFDSCLLYTSELPTKA